MTHSHELSEFATASESERLRVLMVFSQYRQFGGEEQSTLTEAQLLKQEGHEVELLRAGPRGFSSALASALQRKPDIVHIQNFFPWVRPAHYRAIAATRTPIVQSLRNYRLTCMSANHWRNDQDCHACTFGHHSEGVRFGCYRNSHAQSALAATLLRSHRASNTWVDHVSAFIAVSDHVRDTVVSAVGRVPIHVKPNTVVTDRQGRGEAGTVVYAGRLSPEKGIADLAALWSTRSDFPTLNIIGDGPLRRHLELLAARSPNVVVKGPLPHVEALEQLGAGLASIAPWRWLEPFGRSVVESLAVGTPVLLSNSAAERFPKMPLAIIPVANTADSLSQSIAAVQATGVTRRIAARKEFERHYSPQTNLAQLLHIYRESTERARIGR